MQLDEIQCLLHGIVVTDGGGFDELEKPRLCVHVGHEVVHGCHCLFRLEDNEVGAFGHNVELVISDKGGNFHNDLGFRVEARHFKVHPNQHYSNLLPEADDAGSGATT